MLSKKFTRRESVLMGILAFLILVASYYLFIHRPVLEQAATLALQQKEAETQNMILEREAELLEGMREELEAIHADPLTVEIPVYDNLRRVMVFLNTTLSSTMDYDLNFRQVSVPESGKIVRRVIDMSFQCTNYNNARAVVDALYYSPYRSQMGDVSMGPTGGVGEGGSLGAGGVSVGLTITFFERLP